MNTDPFVITETGQLRALASPVRSQIMDLLRQGEERSVAEMARLIGATGPATHYQVGRLLAVGLVVRSGKRRVGPRSEALYRAVSTKIKIIARPESPEYMVAFLALAMTSVRRLEREIIEAYNALSGPQESPAVRMIERRGHVRAEDLPQLYAFLGAAAELIRPGAPASDEARLGLHVFTVELPLEFEP